MIAARNTAYWELAGASVLVGSSVVAGKIATMHMPVFLSQAATLAIALLLLVPLAWRKCRQELRLDKKDVLFLLLQSFLGMFLFRVLMLYGLKTVSAAEAGILTSFTPAAVAVLSFLLLKEAITVRLGAGILCSVAGVLCIGAAGWFAIGPAVQAPPSVFGLLLILSAVLGEAALTVLRKLTSSRVSSLAATTYVTFFSFLMFLPFSLVEASRFDWALLGARDLGLLLYYGLFVTALAYLLWFRGVTKVPAATAAVFTGCIPISTVLLSYVLLHEPFAWAHLAGGAFVFAGIWLVSAPTGVSAPAGSTARSTSPRSPSAG
ncbi:MULTISPECIES: DMT family transporter [Paenibacillus]|uniref:DMT family transporter n=1 Tax=Paenibacillus TaxID=44249 RepID=UPI0022B8EFAD|nr:DMT family transporter [Paenibacillus caseinilyticus]MCZ8520342.1 DMT family transporter [Paenibacillus caseinilyticus]